MEISLQSIKKDDKTAAGQDMIILYDATGYPQALVHIDAFYLPEHQKDPNHWYNQLKKGERVVLTLTPKK